MNRWLIIVGLLVVCHADVAVAASRSPSLLERILSVFHLRPTHHAAPRQTAEKVESPAAKPAPVAPPVEAAEPVHAAHAVETGPPVRAEPAAETLMPPPPQPAPAPRLVQAAPAMAEKVTPAKPPTPPVKAAQAVDAAQPLQSEPTVVTAPAAPAAPAVKAAPAAKNAKSTVVQQSVTPPPQIVQSVEKAPPLPVARPEVKPKPDLIAQAIRKSEPVSVAHPLQAAPPVQTAQAVETTQSIRAVPPIETVPPALPWPEPAPKPAQATQPITKAEPVKMARAVQATPVQPARTVETTQSIYAVASIETTRPALAQPEPAPKLGPPPASRAIAAEAVHQASQTATVTPAPPSQLVHAAGETASEPAMLAPNLNPVPAVHTVKKNKSDRLQQQPVQVAILGAPNLKAALPDENAAPVEAPNDESHAPVRQEPKSACNGGRRIMSAYYWEGHHTASGQPFNPRGMTAAHRTLPFGTRLNVTNPRTGKTVNVLINDRGPFVRGVSLDLSLGAAQAIGLHGTGSVCVL